MKALYRKYRPVKLSEVVGQEQVTRPLENALKSGKISHAYLFVGPRGCGKTSVARIFAHAVNGFDYQVEDSYTDIIEIDAASNTGVDNIRELRERAVITPSQGKYKIYIIDEIHMLSKQAFNALLKILEEPPKHLIFIMATTDAYKIPVTITSRSQVYNFQLATPDIMQKHLSKIAEKEGIKIAPDALEVIVQRGGGSFRDSLSLLDQISTLSEPDTEIKKEAVISALGLPDQTVLDQLLKSYAAGDTKDITNLLKQALDNGTKPEILAENLISRIIESPTPELLPLLDTLSNVAAPFPEAKLLLAFLAEAAKKPVFSGFSENLADTKVSAKTPLSVPPRASNGNSAPSNSQNTSDASFAPETLSDSASAPVASQSPAIPESPAASPAPEAPTPVSFNWESYCASVNDASTVIGKSLSRVEHQLSGAKLYLYCPRNFDRKILESPNNFAILTGALPSGLALEITDDPQVIKKPKKIAQISDIMGADVQEVDTNGVPFS